MGDLEKMTGEQRTVLAVCMLTMFLAPFMSSALNLSITDISHEFQAGATTATWVINAYTIGTAAFSMPFGHLADLYGRRRMLILGTVVFVAASIVSMCAPNIWVLIVARIVMSMGAAIYLAGNVPLMLSYFSPANRGRVLGISVTAVYVGLAAGPVLGGFINEMLGWRWIFVLGIVAAAVSIALAATRIKDDSLRPQAAFDRTGSILFVMAITSFMLGLTEVNNYAWAGLLLAGGAVLLVVFVLFERRVEHPMVQVRLFVGNPTYGFSNLASLLSFGSFFSIGYVMAIYLQNVMGIDSGTAGLIMIILPVGQMAFSAYAGRLSDRHPARIIAFSGMLAIIVGLVILSFVRVGYPLAAIMVGMAIVGVGNAFFGTPNNNAILSCTTSDHYSEANATISTMRGMGQSLSIVLVGFIFSLTVGNTVFRQISPDALAHSISVIMIVSIVIAAAAAACCLVGSKKKQG